MREKVGFIGLGLMGKSMAANLLRKGCDLVVYNRTKKSADELVSMGARVVDSPKEVALNSDIIIEMVTDIPDVEHVLLGAGGAIEGASAGKVFIDMSTNSPDFAISLSGKLGEKGVEFLDAPVTGGDKGAKEGTLTIMVGGKRQVFEMCRSVLECVGKEIVYMGTYGTGQAMKLCNQTAISLNLLAACESLLLGTSAGLNSNDVLKVLTSGAAYSWSLANLGPKILKRDFEPGFKSAHLSKDLRYVIQLAEKNHLSLPGSALAYQLFNSVLAENEGEQGTQILIKVLEKLAARKVSSGLS
jgi:3-hydroxyisobutyrate dehydrogenase